MVLNNCTKYAFQLTNISRRKRLGIVGEIGKFDPQFFSYYLRRIPLEVIARMLRPRKNGNAPGLREPFLQQLNTFAHQLEGEIAHPGEIAPRPRTTLHELP